MSDVRLSIVSESGIDDASPQHVDLTSPEAWRVVDIEPTNLITLLPQKFASDEAPSRERIMEAIASHLGGPVEIISDTPPEPQEDVQWSVLVHLPNRVIQRPVAIWIEPMRDMPAEHLEHLKAENVKWTVGIETVLDPHDPLTDFLALLRVMAQSFPQSPAILNVNTEIWHKRDELDESIVPEDGVETCTSVLWALHMIASTKEPEAPVWVYTRGLHRCGRPELEMLAVPQRLCPAAFGLIKSVADLILDGPIPEPGENFEIGHELDLTLVPWRTAAVCTADEFCARPERRLTFDARTHEDPRAVICAPDSGDADEPAWTCPVEILERLDDDDTPTALYQTRRFTERTAAKARAGWDEFARTFAVFHPLPNPSSKRKGRPPMPTAEFLVKAGFERVGVNLDGSPLDREHLWFKALRFDGRRVQARLTQPSLFVPGLRRGDARWIDADRVSDWRIEIPEFRATLGPDHVKALRQLLFDLQAM